MSSTEVSSISKKDLDNLLSVYEEKYNYIQTLIQEQFETTSQIAQYSGKTVEIEDNQVCVLRFNLAAEKGNAPYCFYHAITRNNTNRLLQATLEMRPINKFSVMELISTQLISNRIGLQIEQQIDQSRIIHMQMGDLYGLYRQLYHMVNWLLPPDSLFVSNHFSHIKFAKDAGDYRVSSVTFAGNLRMFTSSEMLFAMLEGRNSA